MVHRVLSHNWLCILPFGLKRLVLSLKPPVFYENLMLNITPRVVTFTTFVGY